MRIPRERVTIGTLMIVVALTGCCLAAARVHVILGILAAITLILSVVRTSLAIDWLKARNRAAEAGRITPILIDSLNRSACLVTATTIAYLMGSFVPISLFGPHNTHQRASPLIFVIGLLPALGVSCWLRRLYWPPAPARRTPISPD